MDKMERVQQSAETIRAAIDAILNAGRKVPITVPLPKHVNLAAGAADEHTSNWVVPSHPSFSADQEAVKAAIATVKARWDLDPGAQRN